MNKTSHIIKFDSSEPFDIFWLTDRLDMFYKLNGYHCKTVMLSNDLISKIDGNEPTFVWNHIHELSRLGLIGHLNGASIISDTESKMTVTMNMTKAK